MPERFIFTTDRELTFSEEIKNLEFQEVLFPTGDGHLLYGWYLPGSNKRQVILFFHGTATNLSHLAPVLEKFKCLDTGIFVFDYRGFGFSKGKPTEAGTYQDARGALNFLTHLGWQSDQIIYFGHSLGAAIALQLALEQPPAGLVLESPFTSIPDLIRHSYPRLFSALPWAFPPYYDNRAKIGSVEAPIMIFHGRRDTIVPPDMSSILYTLAAEPKSLHFMAEAGHNDLSSCGGEAYWQTWRQFLNRVAGDKRTWTGGYFCDPGRTFRIDERIRSDHHPGHQRNGQFPQHSHYRLGFHDR
ncbi:MAG: alpha/beta hydrolase [Syntrophotaleaceae bacterium]